MAVLSKSSSISTTIPHTDFNRQRYISNIKHLILASMAEELNLLTQEQMDRLNEAAADWRIQLPRSMSNWPYINEMSTYRTLVTEYGLRSSINEKCMELCQIFIDLSLAGRMAP